MSEENGAVVPVNNHAIIDPSNVETTGELFAVSVFDNVEADMVLAAARKSLDGARHRLKTIQGDFNRMVEEVNSSYTDAEADMVRLYVEGCRPELVKCYLTVNRQVALTIEGRRRIAGLVDSLIEATLAKIKTPDPAPEAAPAPLPSGRRKRTTEPT